MADTPLMKQYREMKADYADTVLFFRLGDFYEMFDDDAVEVSSLLNLTLTHRGDEPMCGIPYHAARNYIKRLLDLGKKIAVCEQTELPQNGKTLAKREVVRIITPATVVDEDFLGGSDFNYVLSVFRTDCAWCDISTGDFKIRSLDKTGRIQDLQTVIEMLRPREILVCDDEYFLDSAFKETVDSSGAMVTKLAPWYFNIKNGYKLLCDIAGVANLSSFGIDTNEKGIGPAAALMKYVQETSKAPVRHLANYKVEHDSRYVGLDKSTRRNLELFNNLHDGSTRYSLFSSINRCRTFGGTRLLKAWISLPLRNIPEIEERQDNIRFFHNNTDELDRVKGLIASAMDLNRITTRVFLNRAVPHDLTGLAQAVRTFVQIVSGNPEHYSALFEGPLKDSDSVQAAVELAAEIERAIDPSFLGQFNSGEVILDGYSEELDRLRDLHNHSDSMLKAYLEEEKASSGISILKIGYNRVFGYYLEVPNGQLSKVPEHFIRRQTLVNGERFTTERLKEYEYDILRAEEQASRLEEQLFKDLVQKAGRLSAVLNAMGNFMNLVDVYQGLAVLAIEQNYVCPQLTADDVLEIRDGRHPVVEQVLGPGKFVPNALDLDTRFALITGPNMAGKSTYLRQNALIILLAHTGSFVPASSAKIGVVDRIFCRVGASDNLSGGESTFLVEMQETAYILRNCSRSSFVIVDEIGRGTSTQDGMSIAWAVMRDLIAKGCRTLFATHYHELTMVDTQGIRLLTLEVLENGNNIVFLRRVKEGVANSSYGIHVARMAGVPASVVKDARSFQNRHFADYGSEQTGSLFTGGSEEQECMPSYNPAMQEIVDQIRNCEPDSMTPLQAMLFLSKLKEDATALEEE